MLSHQIFTLLNTQVSSLRPRSRYWLLVTLFVSLAIGTIFFPPILLIPITLFTAWAIKYELSVLKKIKHRRLILGLLSFSSGLGVFGAALDPAHAIEFSFLFANSQNVLDTCLLTHIAGLTILSGIIFGFLRVSAMVGLGVAGVKIFNNRREGQEFQEILTMTVGRHISRYRFGCS